MMKFQGEFTVMGKMEVISSTFLAPIVHADLLPADIMPDIIIQHLADI